MRGRAAAGHGAFGQTEAQDAAEQSDDDGFSKHQEEDVFAGEAERFQDADFGDALTNAHGHGVGGNQQHGKGEGSADGQQE